MRGPGNSSFSNSRNSTNPARPSNPPRRLPQPPPLTYADYSIWQRQNFDPAGAKYREVVSWWQSQLQGCTPLKLPFERSRLRAKWFSFTRRRARHDAHIWWGIPPEISAGLADCSRTLGVTPFSIRLGLLLALLAQTTGQRDLLMAIQSANRTRLETQSIFGFFANRIPLRFRLDPATTLGDWLKSVQTTVAQGQAWALLPIDRLIEELKPLGISPKLRAVFALTYHHEVQRFGGLEFSWQDRLFENRPGQFTIAFNQFRESNHNRASFNPFKHDPAAVRAFLDQFTRYLAVAPKNLSTPLEHIKAN